MKKTSYFFLGILFFLDVAHAQVPQTVWTAGALANSKEVIDFYEAAVKNPIQIISISSEIKQIFASSPDRYKGLNNEVGRNLGFFKAGSLNLKNVELKPEPSAGHPYWNYSISLKRLELKQCEILVKNQALNDNFVRVELNGDSIFIAGKKSISDIACKSQWFFQDGKTRLSM